MIQYTIEYRYHYPLDNQKRCYGYTVIENGVSVGAVHDLSNILLVYILDPLALLEYLYEKYTEESDSIKLKLLKKGIHTIVYQLSKLKPCTH